MSNNAAWSDAENDKMKRMWAEGFSASEISRALGGHRSRNAVIGRIHRMGLSGNMETRRGPPPPRKTRSKVKRLSPAQKQAFSPNRVRSIPRENALSPELREIMALEPVDPTQTIVDAAPLACRYMREAFGPVCGRVAEDGNWCADHRRLVYRPSMPEKDYSQRIERLAALR